MLAGVGSLCSSLPDLDRNLSYFDVRLAAALAGDRPSEAESANEKQNCEQRCAGNQRRLRRLRCLRAVSCGYFGELSAQPDGALAHARHFEFFESSIDSRFDL
jgi:hypothetical protein